MLYNEYPMYHAVNTRIQELHEEAHIQQLLKHARSKLNIDQPSQEAAKNKKGAAWQA